MSFRLVSMQSRAAYEAKLTLWQISSKITYWGFENKEVLRDYVKHQADNPMSKKMVDGQLVYVAQNDFGKLRSFLIVPKISDFGSAI